MFITEVEIEGYRNCKRKSKIKLNKGLNILVGENASGKTTIINAIRMILKDNEMPYVGDEDFYKSFKGKDENKNIRIDVKFEELDSDQEVTFLSWCDADFHAELHLEVEKNPNTKGYYRKTIWGGKSKASAFEEETFDCIDTIYLPALRDAEEKLTNGRKSRLALLLKHQYDEEKNREKLVEAFKVFNQSIIENEDKNFNEIEKTKDDINNAMKESMGAVFGQSINLQFSEASFTSILQSIKMVFFPQVGEMKIEKFRDVAINSLGYNNLLYIATVFAELEVVTNNKCLFTTLLIEEPEAHLHPQLQVKLIKYLQKLVEQKNNLQIIVTSHSAVLAASVGTDTIIHIIQKAEGIIASKISEFEIEEKSKKYIDRWLDVTKSTLLFSKGVILVEGISEAMLLPVLAPIVLKKYNTNKKRHLPESLEEAGVSVININGINFKHFYPLFCDIDDWDDENRLPIRCSGITDKDPRATLDIKNKDKKTEVYPTITDTIEGGNEAIKLADEINNTKNARLFVSPLKTFEYDLAMNNNTKIMAKVIKESWSKDGSVKKKSQTIIGKNNTYKNENKEIRDDSKFIYEHIDNDQLGKGIFAQMLAEKIMNGEGLNVPTYIENAIIWACGGSVE